MAVTERHVFEVIPEVPLVSARTGDAGGPGQIPRAIAATEKSLRLCQVCKRLETDPIHQYLDGQLAMDSRWGF